MYGNEVLKNKNNKIYLILVMNICILLNIKILLYSFLIFVNFVIFGKIFYCLKLSMIRI